MGVYELEIGTLPKRVLTRNKNRVLYGVINNSATNVYLGFDSSVATSGEKKGILIQANGGYYIDSSHKGEVWLIAEAATTVTVFEVTPEEKIEKPIYGPPVYGLPPTAVARIQGYDGTDWQNLRVDSSDYPNLLVRVAAGSSKASCFAGLTDARDSALVGLCTQSYLYGFNGSTWDRLRSDVDMHLYVAPGNGSGSVTGTTTDSYTDALIWGGVRKYLHKTILIKNTGSSNSMDYRVLVEAHSGGLQYEETSGTLGPGDIVKIVLNNHYSRIIVQVKSSTAGAPTEYQIDYCGFKG